MRSLRSVAEPGVGLDKRFGAWEGDGLQGRARESEVYAGREGRDLRSSRLVLDVERPVHLL